MKGGPRTSASRAGGGLQTIRHRAPIALI